MARVNNGSHSFTCHPYTCLHRWNDPCLPLLPVVGGPIGFHQDLWHQETRVAVLPCDVVYVICLAVVTAHQVTTDRQTDRQTDRTTHGRSMYCNGIESRGKKLQFSLIKTTLTKRAARACTKIASPATVAVTNCNGSAFLSVFSLCDFS